MPIVKSKQYALVKTSVLLDMSLSFSARGLYAYLECNDGQWLDLENVDSEINELLAKGLVQERGGNCE
jgi:hypothetical protein